MVDRGWFTALLVAGILNGAGVEASPPDHAASLLRDARGTRELPEQAKAGSGVEGRLDASVLDAPAITIGLADGRAVTASLRRIARDDNRGVQTWIGTFDDPPGGSLVLTRVRGSVSGFATVGDETLEIVPGKPGRHVLYAVDPDAAPSLDGLAVEGGDVVGTTDSSFTGGAGDVGPVVQDILVVYTAASANAWSPATLEGMAQSAVQSANQAYVNSQVGVDLNVVGLQQVSLAESGSGMQTTLAQLKGSTEVRSLRDALGADLVVLVSEETDWCGYASLAISTWSNGTTTTTDGEAWAVVSSRCLSNNSLAHEVGHLQGLDHDRDNSTGGGLYPYAYGYRRCASDGFRDIMSYPCTTTPDVPRILQFSNPSLYYNGYATGVSYELDPSHAADASRALNASAALVASFRDPAVSSSPPPPPPLAPSTVAALDGGNGTASVSWAAVAGATGFDVRRETWNARKKTWDRAAIVASVGSGTLAIRDASGAGTFRYAVRAGNAGGTSGWSGFAQVSVTVASSGTGTKAKRR